MRAIVTVAGHDRVGIIAEVCVLLSERNVNILDISQTVMQEFFTMTMLTDVSASTEPFESLSRTLSEHGKNTGLSIRIQREDIFNAMHSV